MTTDSIYTPELLAPAGGMESVYAAVRSGADAVYLGAKEFSARRSAHNFDEEQLKQAAEYCRLHGVAVHLAVNILVKNEEIESFVNCVKTAARCGIDAFIVQDLGAAAIIKQVCPNIPIHASTQLSVHTPDGVRAMKELGFDRVVLARELSIPEIKEIAGSTDLELEVFVHGALCMSVSGQCYYSAMIGSRSGNRGLCAQPCRLQFSARQGENEHALSLKDLCAADSVLELLKLKIKSFKIEGRMKRPEYVAAAVSAYRNIIDRGSADLTDLRAVFSRSGFTNGYLEANRTQEMFGYRKKEDVTAAAGVLKGLKNSYNKERQNVGVNMRFVLKEGEPAALYMDDNVNKAAKTGAYPEKAINVPLSEEKIKASLLKLGGTPYFAQSVAVEAGEGLTLPVAEINRLRRSCCEQLSEIRSLKSEPELFDYEKIKPRPASGKKELWGRFAAFSDISDYAAQKLSKIILPVNELLRLADGGDNVLFKDKLAAELPRAIFGKERELENKLEVIKAFGVDHAVAQNIASVVTAKRLGFTVHGGFSLNAANDYSAKALKELGADSLIISPELKLSEIGALTSPVPIGMFAYGRLPLMLTRNCPVKREIGCENCKKNSRLYDRKNIEFPVACSDGYTQVLNSAPIYMADRQREIIGCDYLVLYFTDEKNTDDIIRAYINDQAPASSVYTRGLYYRGVL